jgi:NAD-dependent SIR2 family protein deacetylase
MEGPGLKLTASDTTFHVNRCTKCSRVVTKLEILDRLEGRKALPICPCGSNSIRPSNPLWWEYFLPRMIRLAFGVLTGTVKPGVTA